MYWRVGKLQWCWAHLKRDFQKLKDHPNGQVKRLGCDLLRQVKLMFQHWQRYKAGEIQWQTFQRQMRPIRKEVEALLLRGMFSGNSHLYGICKELYRNRKWLWTFTLQEGIEPTNNASERAIRPAVIYRKLCFGTQSESGSRFIERMLTITETCRLQGRSVFPFLAEAVAAHLQGKPAPSLMPDDKPKHHKKKSIAA